MILIYLKPMEGNPLIITVTGGPRSRARTALGYSPSRTRPSTLQPPESKKPRVFVNNPV